jgi:glycosyltransferase involved in cell wall biosynthesis
MGQDKRAAVDVLIPAFNEAAAIRESIASIQAQTLTDIRIIVVDDGSTDATPVILAQIAAEDPRVVVLRRENGGIVDALNAGLAICTADLVARHDGDDIAFPSRLADQVDYLAAHPDCVAVASNAYHIDERGVRTGAATDFTGDVRPDADRFPSHEPYLMHPFLLARRTALNAAKGYRYAFHAEDTDLYWRLLSQGRLHNLAAIHGEYRIHAGSISSSSVLNGRISALNSQLAALSYRRRQAGLPDIAFPRSALEAYKRAETLTKMLDVASHDLSGQERAWLRISVPAKLASLSELRPYQLTKQDRHFIATSWRQCRDDLAPRHRQFLGLMLARRLRRHARRGQLAEMQNLIFGVDLMGMAVFRKATKSLAMLVGRAPAEWR